MRPEGQANWLVHEVTHLRLSHLVETILESIHSVSGTVSSTLLQSIPLVNSCDFKAEIMLTVSHE